MTDTQFQYDQPISPEELAAFVAAVSKLHNDSLRATYPDCELNWETIEARTGKRYAKLVTVHPQRQGGAALAFVDLTTGDIYKPASWSSPAKHARGNIRIGGPADLWRGAFTNHSGLSVAYLQ